MPQVYAAVSDGAGHYLIARKRILNRWWAEYAAPVLAVEALTVVCEINANPVQNWNTAHAGLSAAYQAANGVFSDGIAVFPDAASALKIARDACITSPDGKMIADNTLFAIRNLIDVTIARGNGVALAPSIRCDTDALASSIAAAVDNPLQWNTPRAQANSIASDIGSWAVSQPPGIVNQAGQWALPGGGIHGGESAEAAARREFAEETGFSLDNVSHFPGDPPVELTDTQGQSFWLACFFTKLDLDAIVTSINQATIPRVGVNRPNGSGVCDWELACVQRVNKSQLAKHLGAYQFLTRSAIEEAAYAKAGIAYPSPPDAPSPSRHDRGWQRGRRQAIDWYELIALHLQSLR
ncbi:NUDIX domain-containing protein [Xanthomonas cannabis]|uniref:NUDIX domain-containing protein n=1 Tax=Xanthomonas cannabis TaxID=1885674 RepID=UPI0005745F6B|nr:NUDIX domain-containing protein [Xanthomonas cannabis]KHL52500.1 hypothetical protein OZ10_17410 [Xanthomonas cannabis pv. cannabis]KHL52858.1 hypothetical protein OZ13_17365 [Xanthomonas cannabis pv. cannabis]MCC8443768.1 NUDIX domain-containing protein [Xanthomonas cannabis]